MCFDVWCRTWHSPCVLKLSSVLVAVTFDWDHLRAAVTMTDKTGFADSSFTAAWNSLLVYIWSIDSHSAFCSHLKTYLFTVLYWLDNFASFFKSNSIFYLFCFYPLYVVRKALLSMSFTSSYRDLKTQDTGFVRGHTT